MGTAITVGMQVGAGRWPCSGAHPDGWMTPWQGEVLDRADPRAWAGSVAFPTRRPNSKAVAAHVARHPTMTNKVPVLWDFGTHGKVLYWERLDSVLPYAEDVAAWKQALACAARAAGCQVRGVAA
jgi:hypothetical protein